ncbi:hypothetical protein GCM10010833_29830 [Blastomonas aquatica]|uniref:Uncharacterized protein n=1 Tax=Blastomonas aquatica TaxID=1510276 RepID=A0ABQ1JRC0_9SPHN|nr:hypothetical protein GCM10010833_29830 [Blastomonas aquatica]
MPSRQSQFRFDGNVHLPDRNVRLVMTAAFAIVADDPRGGPFKPEKAAIRNTPILSATDLHAAFGQSSVQQKWYQEDEIRPSENSIDPCERLVEKHGACID